MTANMQKQLQMKNKGGSTSETATPVKSDSCDNSGNNSFNPISLLGMQLPQSGLPGNGKVNGDNSEPPFTSKSKITFYYNIHEIFYCIGPFMLSMIEKIKAAGLNKPMLGEAPLNLSAMLDQNNGHKDTDSDDNSRSGGNEMTN